MVDVIETLQVGGSARLSWPGAHAAKLGPFPIPVRIAARAYSNHDRGDPGSTAWMRLYYEADLVGEQAGEGDPIALELRYEVALLAGGAAAFRLDFLNRGATARDFGFEFDLSRI